MFILWHLHTICILVHKIVSSKYDLLMCYHIVFAIENRDFFANSQYGVI